MVKMTASSAFIMFNLFLLEGKWKGERDDVGSSYRCVLRHRARISPGGSQSVVPVAAVLAFPGREPVRDAGSGVPSHTH